MNNISLLSDDIRSEFSIDEQGRAFASRRAIARLAGVDEKAIRELLKRIASAEQKLAVMLKPIAGQSFEGAELIPDLAVTLIIQYYAYGCQERYRTEQAQSVCAAFQAIGFRCWLQSELGWQKPQVPISPFEMIAQMAMESAKLEKRLNQAEQAINQLVTIQLQAEEELKALPIAELPAPEKPIRVKVNEIVRNYVTRKKLVIRVHGANFTENFITDAILMLTLGLERGEPNLML